MSKLIPKLISDVLKNHTNESITPCVEQYAKIIMTKREEEKSNDPPPEEIEPPVQVEEPPVIEEVEKELPNPVLPEEILDEPKEGDVSLPVEDEEDIPEDDEGDLIASRLRFLMEKGMDAENPDDHPENSPDASPIHDEHDAALSNMATTSATSGPASGLANLLQSLKKSNIFNNLKPKVEEPIDMATTPQSPSDQDSDNGGATPLADEPDELDTGDVNVTSGVIPIVPIKMPKITTQKVEETSSSDSDSSSGESDSSSSDSSPTHHRRARVRPSKAMREKREARRRASNAEITRIPERKG